ncbi:MAG TPA: pantoate--beta-alanine ligase, partial [Rhodanobacter sp.]
EKGHARRIIEEAAQSKLERAGFAPDYAVIRRAEDLAEPADGEREGLVALIAARLGTTRLIDNLPFD